MTTTFGVEEDFVFLDPATLRPADVAARVHEELLEEPEWAPHVRREFLASQLEHASAVFDSLEAARAPLAEFRRRIAERAEELGVSVAGIGATPDALPFPAVSHLEKYEPVVRDMAGLIGDHQFTTLDVHVGVPDREAGVVAINTIRPWIPLLTALGGNSPFWRGYDTGYESWRTIQLRRWPTAGTPPRFRGATDYEHRLRALLVASGTDDPGFVMWNARLSEHLPTVEFRMADAQLTVADTLCIAALCRGLVDYALETEGGEPGEADVHGDVLSAAVMHAAQAGLRDDLYDPSTGDPAPARTVLDRLLERIGPALEPTGESDVVLELTARMVQLGTGASRQRSAFRRGGVHELSSLFGTSMTADAWPRAA
ncbi:YbdK family carboxylate-amine ligase [Agromyces sp. MMS24-JH15]|uniref:carboxylate-amine ligase n=1 Tax=Agromyces sp. MMS24-JH15 TaxID=3243765 RepID=UPI003748DE63